MTMLDRAALVTVLALVGGCAAGTPAGSDEAPGDAPTAGAPAAGAPAAGDGADAPIVWPDTAPAATDSLDGKSFETAKPLHPGDEAIIPGGVATRFFVVRIPRGDDGILKVAFADASESKPSTVTIYDAKRRPVGSGEIAASAGHAYYVEVIGSSPSGSPIKVTFEPVTDPFEPNDDVAAARPIASGATLDVKVFAGHDTNDGIDTDFFSLDTRGRQAVRIQLANHSGSDAPQWFTVKVIADGKTLLGGAGSPELGGDIDAMFALPPSTARVVFAVTARSSVEASQATFSAQ
jgi:hypothetical protein